jgi:hypothetical protein
VTCLGIAFYGESAGKSPYFYEIFPFCDILNLQFPVIFAIMKFLL